ncbi:MAG TPA: hypothetical protein VE136_04950 [Anaerolineales bacterium]|jgi:hypothetical protein|nr:hypothetical protein [Anaerolineales bacterium]
MSKKRRRQIRRDLPTSSGKGLREDFDPDYQYVVKDLRRIGTLAGTFLAILVVLSFFLR